MDSPEAARMLGVAESEVVDIKAEAGWWHALHHDMASHTETWRPVIEAPEPEAADEPAEVDPKPAATRKKTR